MEEQKRGQLTQRIVSASSTTIFHPISKEKLRLIPYIVDVMLNDQKINARSINPGELEILRNWDEDRHISFNGMTGAITVTEKFWNDASKILYLGYVDLSK